MVRFDAYSATTTEAKPADMVSVISDAVGGMSNFGKVTEGKGFHTFGKRMGFHSLEGPEWASIQWGGSQGDRVMIEVKGENTPKAVEAIRSRFSHRCTRVDACADFDVSGVFERLVGVCQDVKKKHRLKGEKQGDWDDFPELGRTLYVGARASVSRVRLYEKGKQPEYVHLEKPNWTRLEVQVRPAKEAKTTFATLSPIDVWGASTWTKELAGAVLEQHVDPHPAGTIWRPSERDAALQWMCKQYGSHLVDLANELGGWDCLGLTLNEIIKQEQIKARYQ